MRASIRALARSVGVLAAVMLVVAACGQATAPPPPGGATTSQPSSQPSPSPSPSSPTSPSQSSPPATTPPAASAAAQLASFVGAAEQADAYVRHAAALINGDITATSMRFTPATLAAVKAIDNSPVARAIPAGLPAELLREMLTVYGDLEARAGALRGVLLYDSVGRVLPIGSADAKGVLRCLHHGSAPAARFGTDLAAMRALAAQTPPVTVAPESSRAAAEVALRINLIDKANNCSYECGGYAPTQLEPVSWQPSDNQYASHYVGTIGHPQSVNFQADYHPGTGWVAVINAC